MFDNAAPKSYIGTAQGNPSSPQIKEEGSLITELKSLNRSAYELRARLQKTGDVLCGLRPENGATEAPSPQNVLSLVQEIGRVLDNCHEELTRTTSLLGM